jgi:hypothetical protein
MIEVFILLFADDIVLLSTTPIGLQTQLNSLKTCCDRLKLEVNKDKTKIMVFRKGGYLSSREKWYYDNEKIEVVNSYSYLGYTFTTMLSAKRGTSHLSAKGRKAVYQFIKVFDRCKQMTQQTYFKVFEAKIQPILLYSSEIWGCIRLENIEKVHMMSCKHFLGVPLKTPNKMVYSELARYPLLVNSSFRCINYWFRLLSMDRNRLPSQAYHMLKKLDDSGKTCWASLVKDILSNCGFYHVWLNQGVGNVKAFMSLFRQRLIDVFLQEWSATIRDRDRYSTYRTFQSIFIAPAYMKHVNIYCFRVALTQIRVGVLPINCNLFRFSENEIEKLCPYCRICEENEHHFIFACPLFHDIRTRWLSNMRHLSLSKLLEGTNKVLSCLVAKYVYYAIRRRQNYVSTI